MKTPHNETEKGIQKAIMEYLQYSGWLCWRNNSGWIPQVYKGKQRMIHMGLVGLPDVFAIKDGTLLGVEVKRPGKQATYIQEQMHEQLREHGAVVLVARSVQDVQEFVEGL